MKYARASGLIIGFGLIILVATVFSAHVRADSFTGTSYKIDASVMNNFGGSTVSPSYKMVSGGGESIIGNGLGGSYLLSQGYTAQLGKSLQISSQPTGLKAYYTLDETYGSTAYDSTVGDNTAKNAYGSNLTWLAGSQGQVNGALDQSLSSAYLQSSTSPLPSTNTFSFEGWFYPYGTSSGMALMAQDDFSGTGDKWNISVNATGGLTFLLQKSGTPVSAVGAGSFSINTWHHVVGTYDGSDMRLYVDGGLYAQQSNTAGAHNFTLPLIMGARNVVASPNFFNGRVDNIKVYDRTLPLREIADMDFSDNVFSNPASVTIDPVTPGVSMTKLNDIIIQTDAPGYNLNVRQFYDLQGETVGIDIPAIPTGTIATPVLWSEGTTKGLGFTLTNALMLDSKWGSSPTYKYAALPNTTTTFYSRTGYTGGTKDVITMQYRLDTLDSVIADEYYNVTAFTGTMIP